MIAPSVAQDPDRLTAPPGGDAYVDAWTRTELPALNLAILAGTTSPGVLVRRLNEEVLPWLPAPATLTPEQARRVLLLVGLWGSSVVRHFAEHGLQGPPGNGPLDLLRARGGGRFLELANALAERTGTGHPPRDGYVSTVHWNVPPVEVIWHGELLGSIDSAFDDGELRTFTGLRGEREFLLLLKRAEAAEAAANRLLEPLWNSEIALDSPEWCRRALLAADMLRVVHALNCEFREREGAAALDAGTFIDVIRQFAVSWRGNDLPPSGAQDHEWLLRDLILGIDLPGYELHVRRQFPAMTDHQRDLLKPALGRDPLPAIVIRECGSSASLLEQMSDAQLARLVTNRPALAACFLVARANAQVTSSHLGLTKKLLFNPMRAREAADTARRWAVSNGAGATGIPERQLELLTASRKRHALRPLARVNTTRLRALAGFEQETAIDKGELDQIVRVTSVSR